jgi:DNA polymerase
MISKQAARHVLWWHQQMGITTSMHCPPPPCPTVCPTQSARQKDLLDALRHDMATVPGCTLSVSANNLVFADGNHTASIMIVGEAPGADEDAQGKPFVGASGQLLDAMLKSIHLDRSCVYITNTVPWRPLNNRQPTDAERATYLPFLQRHISIIQPKLIICVGAIAYKTLINRPETLTQSLAMDFTYQCPVSHTNIHTVTLYHPAYLMRCPNKKKDAWHQLLRIQTLIPHVTST